MLPGSKPGGNPSAVALFASGLRTGLLTFGGAYTAIPFLRNDAVNEGRWMTDAQFLDGLALTGVLPAPLVIFGTFVGYVGGGLVGALSLTAGIFLPAFAFTLVAHDPLERLVMRPAVHTFLHGVTAAVVGLIAISAIILADTAVIDGWTSVILAGVLLLLYRSHAKARGLCRYSWGRVSRLAGPVVCSRTLSRRGSGGWSAGSTWILREP